jgi:hypothetical protein
MAGAFSDNQPDNSWVQPGEVKVAEQWFYPIRELGGLKAANLDAAINLDVKEDKQGRTARLALNTTSERRGATVRLASGDRMIFTEKIDIGPE